MGKSVLILSTIKLYNGNSAGSSRMMNVARALAFAGCNVYLCSSKLNVNVDRGHMREVFPNIFEVGEEYAGRRSLPYRIMNRFFHFFWVIRYLFRVLSIVRNIEGEKVFYLYPQPEISLDIASLVFAKILFRLKIYADINELRTATLSNDRTLAFGRRIYAVLKFQCLERFSFFYDGLVVISTRLEERFSRYNNNIIRVPVLCGDVDASDSVAAEFSPGDPFKLCFAGEIRFDKEGFGDLYRAVSEIRRRYEKLELHLYGPVLEDQRQRILHDVPEELGVLDCLHYHGVMDQTALASEIKAYHLMLLVRPKTRQAQFGFSTKLGEYLVSGVPVLTTDSSDIPLFIKDRINGFLVTTTDPDVVAKKILDIISEYDEIARKVGSRAQMTARDFFHFRNYSEILSNFLRP
jgi:glycosyltransferase involved in cell wall biosynthesis